MIIKKHLLPIDLNISKVGLAKWLKRRNILKNKAYANKFLLKQGLSPNCPMDIISEKVSRLVIISDSVIYFL